jgi:hypothetical protein
LWLAIQISLDLTAALRCSHAQLLNQYFPGGVPGYGDEPGVTVPSRQRPEYQAQGIREGGIVISPSLSEAIGYDSNVVGLPQARGSDFVQTQGNVSVQSNVSGHNIGIVASVTDSRYPQQPEQSTTNWTLFAGGKFNIGGDQLIFGAAHLSLNETPRDLGIPQLTQPEPFTVDDAKIAYNAIFNRISLQPAVDFSSWRYDNITQNGVPRVLDYQSRDTAVVSLTSRYDLSPAPSYVSNSPAASKPIMPLGLDNLVLVVRGIDNRSLTSVAGQPNRDSIGAAVLGGVDHITGGALSYRALVGYDYRSFTSSQYSTISAPIVEADVTWTPTERTTVTGSLTHEIQDANQTNVVAGTLTQVRLAIDHEYLRNLLLHAQAQVQQATYQQNVSSQELYNANAGVTWLLNRNMRLAITYTYWNRQSGIGSSYSEHIGLLQLRFGL